VPFEARQAPVKVAVEVAEACRRGRRKGPDDHQGGAQPREVAAYGMAEPTLDPVAYDGVADGLAHHDADTGKFVTGKLVACTLVARDGERMDHQGAA
jgi:hypothetical protein